jgi:predicted anti-sigma-YlaC factor YlaD
MKCHDLYRRLTEHADGVLDAADCAAVDHHLLECASCGALRRDLEDLSRLCRESSRPRMPDDVRRRIEALLRPSPEQAV